MHRGQGSVTVPSGSRGSRQGRDPVTVEVTGGEETSDQELLLPKKEKLGAAEHRGE